ncbi:MAG: alpha/beta hydrolase [Anaerolineaceae bacterium]|nr:alpha/beta hydrolase [Anaerolineaceae bacterium]
MPSIPSRFIIWLEKIFRLDERMARYAGAADDRQKFDEYIQQMRRLDQKKPPRYLRKHLKINQQTVEDFPLFMMSSPQGRSRKAVLYLHGGAYTIGPMIPQWARMRDLVEDTHCTVALLDYPKAPEHQCEQTLMVCMEAFDRLAMAFGADNVILMGDSAGGGLALALSMHRKVLAKSLPAHLILISPWLDVSMSNPQIPEYEALDLSLDPVGLRVQGGYYAGKLSCNDPRVSPMFGDMAGQPAMDVYVGTHELFYPDCRDFCTKYAAQDVTLHAYEEMQHDWVMMPIPEGNQAIKEIVSIIKN